MDRYNKRVAPAECWWGWKGLMLLVGGVRGTADVHMIWSPPLLIPSNAHPPKRHHQRQQWKYHRRWRFAGKTGGHVLALKTTDLKKSGCLYDSRTRNTKVRAACVNLHPFHPYILFFAPPFALPFHRQPATPGTSSPVCDRAAITTIPPPTTTTFSNPTLHHCSIPVQTHSCSSAGALWHHRLLPANDLLCLF